MDRSVSLLVKFAGIDKLTGKMRTIGGASKKTAANLTATRREIDLLKKAQAKIAGYKDAETAFTKTAAAIDEQRQKLVLLRAEKEKAEGSTKKLDRAIATAERNEKKLTDRHEQEGAELQQLSGRLQTAGMDVANLARHEDRLANEVYDTNKRLKQQREELERRGAAQARVERAQALGGRMQAGGATATAAGATILAPLVLGVREAVDFESAMADVRKVVDGLETPAAFKGMSRDIVNLSRELPISAKGLAAIVAAGGQAGLAREELLPFARDAAKMGVAFDIAADEAGDTMAKWRTAFRLGQTEVVDLADKVNYLSDKTAAAPGQISAIVTRVGPLGEVAGLAAGQIAALGATLASMGVNEEIAATGIKNTMLALTKGEAATKSQQKAFTALGLESTNIAKSMQRDATGTIMMVMEKIAALPDYQRASILDQLFGSESIGAIAPLLTQLPKLRENLAMVGDGSGYAGSMMREFDSRNQTSAARLQRFNNRIDALKIGIGDRLLPIVEKAADWIGDFADRLSAWADRNPGMANGLLIFAAALGTLLVVGGGLALLFGTLLGPLAAFAGVLGVGLLPAIGIVAAVVAGVAALGAAAYLIYNNWSSISGFFQSLWTDLKTAFDGGLWGVIALLWKWGGQLLSIVWTAVSGAFNWLIANFPALGAGVKTVLWNVLWNGLLFLPRMFFQFGANTIKGFVNGILGSLGWLKEKVLGVGTQVVGWFKGVLGIKSPSRVFMGLGGFLTEGLALGIDRGASEPLARMRNLAGKMTTALAIGASTTSPAAASSGAAGKAGAATIIHHHSYQIYLQGGGDMRDQARELFEEIKRLQQTERGSAYRDDD